MRRVGIDGQVKYFLSAAKFALASVRGQLEQGEARLHMRDYHE